MHTLLRKKMNVEGASSMVSNVSTTLPLCVGGGIFMGITDTLNGH